VQVEWAEEQEQPVAAVLEAVAEQLVAEQETKVALDQELVQVPEQLEAVEWVAVQELVTKVVLDQELVQVLEPLEAVEWEQDQEQVTKVVLDQELAAEWEQGTRAEQAMTLPCKAEQDLTELAPVEWVVERVQPVAASALAQKLEQLAVVEWVAVQELATRVLELVE
jgi:hypothetical protein